AFAAWGAAALTSCSRTSECVAVHAPAGARCSRSAFIVLFRSGVGVIVCGKYLRIERPLWQAGTMQLFSGSSEHHGCKNRRLRVYCIAAWWNPPHACSKVSFESPVV